MAKASRVAARQASAAEDMAGRLESLENGMQAAHAKLNDILVILQKMSQVEVLEAVLSSDDESAAKPAKKK